MSPEKLARIPWVGIILSHFYLQETGYAWSVLLPKRHSTLLPYCNMISMVPQFNKLQASIRSDARGPKHRICMVYEMVLGSQFETIPGHSNDMFGGKLALFNLLIHQSHKSPTQNMSRGACCMPCQTSDESLPPPSRPGDYCKPVFAFPTTLVSDGQFFTPSQLG